MSLGRRALAARKAQLAQLAHEVLQAQRAFKAQQVLSVRLALPALQGRLV